MSKDLGVLYLSSACPDSDSGSVVARHSLSKDTGYSSRFLNLKRLVVGVKDMRTQLCQQSHTREENKFSLGQMSDLSRVLWQVSCNLV